MKWNEHSDLKGKHAILSPSNSSWINYGDNEELYFNRYLARYAADVGTLIHEYAQKRINKGRRLTKPVAKDGILSYLEDHDIPSNAYDLDYIWENVMNYVNDAIHYHLDTEIPLLYSKECFGTADAIDFNEKTKELRIHDLKTGKTQPDMNQLLTYAALFCLEYGYKPKDISCELRIYKYGEYLVMNPTTEELEDRISAIIKGSKILKQIKGERS